MKTLAVLACVLTLSIGCASLDGNELSASGDSSAYVYDGDMTTTTTTAPDGTKTVIEVCTNCTKREVVGGSGSADLYKMFATFFSIVLSGVSIAIQALK